MSHEFTARHQQEEAGASLARVDSIDVYRYLQTFCRIKSLEPEKKLMLAVLEDALGCLQKYVETKGRKGRKEFWEARQWLLSDTEEWTFSFVNICDALGINPSYLRGRTLRWMDAQWGEQSSSGVSKTDLASVSGGRCGH